MHSTSVQQRQYIIARRLQPDSKYIVLYDSMYEYVRVYTSMYEYIPVCTSTHQYNQGLQIFMISTYLFFTFGSKIQRAVLRRCISAFINNRKQPEGMTKLRWPCFCKYKVYALIYSVHGSIYVDLLSYPNSFSSHCFFISDSTIRCTVMGGA